MSGATEKCFTLPQIAAMAGAEYRTLKTWQDRRLIRPSIYAGKGTGRPNLYSEHDAEIVVSLVNLRSRGLDMVALGVVAAAWRAGELPECPICHRSELKLPMGSPAKELKERDDGE